MIATGVMFIGFAAFTQEGPLMDVALHHNWRILSEAEGTSFAVMSDVPADAANRRFARVVLTRGATAASNSALPVQEYAVVQIDCEASTFSPSPFSPTSPAQPPRRYVHRDGAPPPITAAPAPHQPIPEGSMIAEVQSVICDGQLEPYKAVEGDWSTVLNQLLAERAQSDSD